MTPVHGDDMNESILDSVKKLIGLDQAYDAFNTDIIIHINSVLMLLNQLGVGNKGFSITGSEETWADFLGEDSDLHMVKSYVAMKTRLVFDPPTSGTVMEALKQSISEMEWRLNVHVDPDDTFVEENQNG